MSERLKSVDVLRGLAASAVVAHHALSNFSFGRIGVDFFFVISGFVIYYARQGRTASQFIRDRFWRIFPIYWVAVAPWVLLSLFRGTLTPAIFFDHAALIPFWFTTYMPLLFVAWTLIFECTFYLATALSIWLRSCVIPVGIFALAAIGWALGGPQQLQWIGNPIILEFLLGLLVAILPKNAIVGRISLAVGLTWLISYPAANNPMEFQIFESSVERTVLWGIPAALIIYGAIANEQKFQGRIVKSLCFIGVSSYSIYLFHPLITHIVPMAPQGLKLIAAFAVGISAWAFLERPMYQFSRRAIAQNSNDGGGKLAAADT